MITRKDLLKIKQGDLTVRTELLKKYPVQELVDDLCEIIAQGENTVIETPKPIVLSDEDYNRLMGMFRQRGVALDGSPITRGRKKKGEGQVKCN